MIKRRKKANKGDYDSDFTHSSALDSEGESKGVRISCYLPVTKYNVVQE